MPISTMPSGSCLEPFVAARVFEIRRNIAHQSLFLIEHECAAHAGSGINRPAVTHERRRAPSRAGNSRPRTSTCTDAAGRDRHARQTDGARQRRRERAAGDLALADPGDDARADGCAARHAHPAPGRRSLCSLPRARMASSAARPMNSRCVGSNATRPGQARFERVGLLVHVVAVQVHAGLQPQRVARPEAAGAHAGGIEALP